MVFTSQIFLFYFLPAVLFAYFVIPIKRSFFVLLAFYAGYGYWHPEVFLYGLPVMVLAFFFLPDTRNFLLLMVSYAFYGWWEPWFILLMLAATLVNYLGGHVIATSPRGSARARTALTLSVICSLSMLGFFKYFTFAQSNLNALMEWTTIGGFSIWEIALPAGISFYIFQSLSYSVDVYRGESPPVKSFWDFACYVALFPQLIAGPIVRYKTIADQLVDRKHSIRKFSSGTALFIIGFAKKVLLADSMGGLVDAAFAADSLYMLDAWVGVIAYAFQLYFDFSGYSDMAIGLGRMVGFEFPRNFNAPYRATSITDFWRRWHISLSTFLRDYLYIPLGGNRKGTGRMYVNLALVMLLGGMWHGANWTFIAWGGFHGAVLILERLRGKGSYYERMPVVLQVAITFVLVLISWVFFRAATISHATEYLSAMFGMANAESSAALMAAQFYQPGRILELGLCAFLVFAPWQGYDWVERLSLPRVILLILLFALAIGTMFTQAFSPFLYFQF